MFALVIAFFITALIYASAGLGGGSAYLPLLGFGDVDERLLPAIALTCNMIVVSGSLVNFARHGHLNWRFALPFALISMPFAWIGGQISIDRETFRLVLGLVLLGTAAALFYTTMNREKLGSGESQAAGRWIGLPVGAGLGFLSGVTGIGGGVFLAPILHGFRLASTQLVASTCSLFIFVNSAAGFASHATRLVDMGLVDRLYAYAPLFLAVLVGGILGNVLNITKLSSVGIHRVTSFILIFAGIRLIYGWLIMG